MKVKICGMKFPANIQAVSALNPDYMGFIFFNGSKRHVGEGFSGKTVESIPKEIKKVGVFVNESLEEVIKKNAEFNFDFIQLHGNESPEYCKELNLEKLPLIKAFNLHDDFDFSELEAYQPYCHYFLFDSQTAFYGGSGKSFNWQVLSKYEFNTPFFLSGGLGPENISEALSINHPMLLGFDLNSKLESEPGLKKMEKTKQMIEKIKTHVHL
jgi:phosphoribosylanthranilate isomerase